MDTHGQNLILLRNAGYIESVAADLPLLKEKDKFARPIIEVGNKIRLYILYLYTNIWINTNLVKPGAEPTSWHDLLNLKWRGKIILTNPRIKLSPGTSNVSLHQGEESGMRITLSTCISSRLLAGLVVPVTS